MSRDRRRSSIEESAPETRMNSGENYGYWTRRPVTMCYLDGLETRPERLQLFKSAQPTRGSLSVDLENLGDRAEPGNRRPSLKPSHVARLDSLSTRFE